MSWSEIKYAVNSTVGTSKFKPLDQFIESLISINPTSEVIFEQEYKANVQTVIFEETMNFGGSIRVFNERLLPNATLSTKLYINDSEVTTGSQNFFARFNKGDKVRVEASGTVSTGSTYNAGKLTIYGSVQLGQLFR